MTLNKLWILQMILIAWGYVYMATFLLMLLSTGLSLITYLFGEQRWGVRLQQWLVRIPLAGPKIKPFRKVADKTMSECIICMNEFGPEDKVAELKCDERHYFHQECLAGWLKHKQECPLCKKHVDSI